MRLRYYAEKVETRMTRAHCWRCVGHMNAIFFQIEVGRKKGRNVIALQFTVLAKLAVLAAEIVSTHGA